MGIFPHSDRLISSKGGELYRKSAQSRVEGERSFRISKNPIVEIRARFARIFPTCREDDMHSRLCAEKKRSPSQRPSIFSHWSNGMPMQVSSKQFLIFLFHLPDGAFLLREIVRIKTWEYYFIYYCNLFIKFTIIYFCFVSTCLYYS